VTGMVPGNRGRQESQNFEDDADRGEGRAFDDRKEAHREDLLCLSRVKKETRRMCCG